MHRTRSFLGRAVLLALATSACSPARPIIHSAPTIESVAAASSYLTANGAVPTASSDERHVIVISIDGLRPDAIERFGAKTLQRLIDEGTYSLAAQTITPSITLPSHTSMLTGAGPDVHGITWNDNQVADRGRVKVPTIFEVARAQGLETAAFASKGKFNHLFEPSALDYFVVPQGNGSWSSGRTAAEVDLYLQSHAPNLLFAHFREPDRYGHIFGWMGFMYGWAVREADDAVAEVLAAADRAFGEGGYTVIVTADHGGHGRDHGASTDIDTTIPWMAWGRGVTPGELPDGIHTTDTAATALWLLDVQPPETVAGHPIRGAFDAGVLALDGEPDELAGAARELAN